MIILNHLTYRKIKTQRRGDAEKKSLRLRVLAFYTQGARIGNVKYIVYKKIETMWELRVKSEE